MADAPRLFIYARKSSKPEDRQALSIPRQVTELTEFADRAGVAVVGMLMEKESAKKPGRPVFNELLRRIEKGEAEGILAWHPDRLARNSSDASRIVEMLERRTIRHLRFPSFTFDNTPSGRFSLGMAFVQSAYYSDNLSEVTKAGFREKIRRKEYPGVAPIGYLNDSRIKRIVIDRKRAPIVREVFERYATGTETLDSIRAFLRTKGVVSRKNKKLICRRRVRDILKSPTYYGHFRWAGEIHEGGHEPIISKRLFDEVQDVLSERKRWSPKSSSRVPKVFTQLLRCGLCGYAVTAEIQKGHTYYRCTKKSPDGDRCPSPYVREERLAPEISALFAPYSLTDTEANELLAMLDAEQQRASATAATLIAEKQQRAETAAAKLGRLKNMLIDGLIDHDEAAVERAKLMSEKKTLEEEIDGLTAKPSAWLEPFRDWILTAQRVRSVADSAILTERAALAKKIFGSNLVLENGKARGKAVNPWSYLTQRELGDTLVTLFYAARTHFQNEAISLGAASSRRGRDSNLVLNDWASSEVPAARIEPRP